MGGDELDAMERHAWVPTGTTVRIEGWFGFAERRKVERRRVVLSRIERWMAWLLMVDVDASRTDLERRSECQTEISNDVTKKG